MPPGHFAIAGFWSIFATTMVLVLRDCLSIPRPQLPWRQCGRAGAIRNAAIYSAGDCLSAAMTGAGRLSCRRISNNSSNGGATTRLIIRKSLLKAMICAW